MDSLTQIVLGAAVGEIALGRKIGNRAMIWGAIGGTIPDLDILANPFMDDIQSLAFHRGISHSIFFSVVASFLFGALTFKLYDSKFHKSRFYKILISIINLVVLIAITYGINILFSENGNPNWWVLFFTSLIAIFLIFRLYKYYLIKDLEEPVTTFREWYWLFFLAFFTHFTLDCFTAFGTQIFQPFSDYRVAFNNISVVDPGYTLPFLICVILASTLKRNTRVRAMVIWIGIGISSLYMLMTIVNKIHVDAVFDQALKNRNIEVLRCRTSPTIFNNLLWTCVAEGRNEYYVGQYSIFDSDPNLHLINVIPKNDSLHQMYSKYPDYKTLLWFSEGYLAIYPHDTITVMSDLRYGGMSDTIRDNRDLVFNFLVKEVNGVPAFFENRERPQGDIGLLFRKLVTRMKGY